MRKCPKCNFTFTRCKIVDKIRHCPTCGVAIHYKGQETVLLEDKIAVDMALAMVSHRIEEREGIKPFPDARDTARERKFAYDILGRCKRFLEKNQAIVQPHKFFVGLLEYILNNPWWGEHIKTILQLQNSISKLAVEYYSIIRSRLLSEQSLESSHRALAGSVGSYVS